MNQEIASAADDPAPTEPSFLPRGILADHFDGRSAQPRQVLVCLQDGQLALRDPGTGVMRHAVDPRQVQWPERTRHGARIAHLPDGGSLHALDPAAWDRWRSQEGHRASWVVRSQQSWRAVAIALVLLVAALGAIYQWGLPLAAKGLVSLTPRIVDQHIGEAAFASIDAHWFQPSRLPPATQAKLRDAFTHAARQAHVRTGSLDDLPVNIVFRRSRMGPNALTFPDGTIVFTDELVELLEARHDVLIGVFGHEWGHLQHRHSMRQLVQATAIGAVASLVVGDFSSLLAAAPALIANMGYSRDFERQADDVSIQLLQANGIQPATMVLLFDKLRSADHGNDEGPGFAFSSHPSDAERIKRFRTP